MRVQERPLHSPAQPETRQCPRKEAIHYRSNKSQQGSDKAYRNLVRFMVIAMAINLIALSWGFAVAYDFGYQVAKTEFIEEAASE